MDKKKRSSLGLTCLITGMIIWQGLFWVYTQMHVPTRSEYILFGAPYASEIYSGQYWGVISNSFLHYNPYHFIGNVILLFLFARRIERSYGTWFFLFLLISSSFITSCVQLANSGDAGLGLTPVNLAFIYFMLRDEHAFWKKKWIKLLAYLLGIAFISFAVINLFTQWILLGFSAFIAAMIYGYTMGIWHNSRKKQFLLTCSLSVICAFSLLYNPYSSEWNTVKGYQAFQKNDLPKARQFYLNAISLSSKNVVARKSLNLISIDSLSTVAYKLHETKNYNEAKEVYLEILKLDSNYRWAKENIERLP